MQKYEICCCCSLVDVVFRLLKCFGLHCFRYGVMLEHFHRQDPSLMDKIRGCIVDSAPVANADAEVKA
jgi:hypothetical protein